jgi:methylenetetrahydrofolate reductase (NADPH)
MRIDDLLKTKRTFSFEVFPPKSDKPIEPMLETLNELYKFKPDFISCTYGAGGSDKGRNLEVCKAIKDAGNEVASHFTCVGANSVEILETMRAYREIGIENVLALRGDIPKGWESARGDFAHASELLAFLTRNAPGICFGAAGYPEKHPSAPSFGSDTEFLRAKQASGAAFIVTQLCHDTDAYARFLARVRRAGVNLPIIAGLMPTLFREGTIRMTLSNGCSIPRELAEIIGKYADNPDDFKKAGKEYTVRQIGRFLDVGANGLHIYSMNKHEDIAEILIGAGYEREER